MIQIMTASGMSDGQIEAVAEQLRAAMRKHRDDVQKDAAQQALGVDNLGMRMFVVFRELAEEMSNLIVRHVKVDRSQTPQQALDATGRKQYTNREVVDAMPRGENEEVDVCFFNLDYDPTVEELDREYELRGLKADPIAQAKVNTDNPAFADDRPNGCQWGLENGVASFATFDRWRVERDVGVDRDGIRWSRCCRFGGVRK